MNENVYALSPLDGRYYSQVEDLSLVLSEYGLMHHRLFVEIAWFIALSDHPGIEEIPTLSEKARKDLENMHLNFSKEDAIAIKNIEKETNHDLKAVEYFLKSKMQAHEELKKYVEWVHFACTSEDINNLAYGLMLTTMKHQSLLPKIETLIAALTEKAHQYANLPMLARTHGQPASPTTLGKEFANFVARLRRHSTTIANLQLCGKSNGAVGNFNAHYLAYPNIDWQALSKNFVESLGLTFNAYTTQIEPHDALAELLDATRRFNATLIDFCKDIWGYIAMDYFKMAVVAHEVGSSTMPHKVNPIEFENAEGNLGLANAILSHMSSHFLVSRWQRDLTDSTLLRNLGVVFGHTLQAVQNTLKGLEKLSAHEIKIAKDLDENWEVLSEGLQTIMRRYGFEKPYEHLKQLTRGQKINKSVYEAFISGLSLPEAVKLELQRLTPHAYIGVAAELAEKI